MNAFVRKHFRWLLGITLSLGAAWYFWAYPMAPRLSIDWTTSASVLSAQEGVPGLDVSFGDRMIQPELETLRLITVRIRNDGQAIDVSGYYPNYYVGFRIENVEILSASVVSANSDYLKREVILSTTPTNVSFFPIPIDRNEHFDIQLLLVHSVDIEPEVLAIGKILSQDEIQTYASFDDPASIWTRILDFSLAAIPWLLGFVVLLVISSSHESFIERSDRKYLMKLLEEFRSSRDYEISAAGHALLKELPIHRRADTFFALFNVLLDDDLRQEAVRRGKIHLISTESKFTLSEYQYQAVTRLFYMNSFDLEKFDFKPDVKPIFEELIVFLKNRGLLQTEETHGPTAMATDSET